MSQVILGQSCPVPVFHHVQPLYQYLNRIWVGMLSFYFKSFWFEMEWVREIRKKDVYYHCYVSISNLTKIYQQSTSYTKCHTLLSAMFSVDVEVDDAIDVELVVSPPGGCLTEPWYAPVIPCPTRPWPERDGWGPDIPCPPVSGPRGRFNSSMLLLRAINNF